MTVIENHLLVLSMNTIVQTKRIFAANFSVKILFAQC